MTIHFTGKTPNEQDYPALKKVSFDHGPISAIERKVISKARGMDALKLLGSFVGMLALSVLMFGGGRESRMGMLVLAGVIGFGASAYFLIHGIISLKKMSKIEQCQTAKDALSAFVERILMGDDSKVFRNRSTLYAYTVLKRMQPTCSVIDQETFETYIAKIRQELLIKVQEGCDAVFRSALIYKSISKHKKYSITQFDLMPAKTLAPGIEQHKTVFNIEYSVSYNDGEKTVKTPYSNIKLVFDAVLVKTLMCWYVYDPMPEYTIVDSNAP